MKTLLLTKPGRSSGGNSLLSHFAGEAGQLAGAIVLLFAAAQTLSAATVTFQQGANGYAGTFDTYVRGASPDTVHDEIEVSADGADAGAPIDALIRFEDIFGDGLNQVPLNATILSAQLVTSSITGNSQSGSQYGIYPMLVPWDETGVTWNSFVGGVDQDDLESSSIAEVTFTPNGTVPFNFTNDVTVSVQNWFTGSPNYGWVINIISGTDGFDFASSENANLSAHPMLVVVYQGFLTNIIIATQPQSVITNEGATVNFTIGILQGDPRFQWYKDGNPIPDATNATLTLTGVTANDDGNYHVVLENDFPDMQTSETVFLSVNPDVTPPHIVIAYALNPNLVTVVFSEPMDPVIEFDPSNFYLESTDDPQNPDVVFVSQIMLTNPFTALLTLEGFGMLTGFDYEAITALDLRDRSFGGNFLPSGTRTPIHQFLPAPEIMTDVVRFWRYMESGAPEGWQDLAFDDGTWIGAFNGFATPTGDTMADPNFSINTTTLTPPSATHITTYFRTVFNWASTSSVAAVEFMGAFDDGGVVYINGQELFRVRMPEGPILNTTLAIGGGAGDPSHDTETFIGIATNLQESDNVLAIEVHQNASTSSDILLAAQIRLSVPVLPSGVPEITQQPQGATIPERGSHTFAVQATGALPLSYQWFLDDVEIFGADTATYTVANAVPSQSGSYKVRVVNADAPNGVFSDPAILTVTPDTTPPTIIAAVGETNLTTFRVTFSELVALPGADTPGNYTIQLAAGGGALTVDTATLLPDGVTVVLTTSAPRTQGQNYTLTVNGVTDTAQTPNAVTPNTRAIASEFIVLAPDDITLWRYDQSSNDLSSAGWQLPGYDDSSWATGLAGLSSFGEEAPPGYDLRTFDLNAMTNGGPRTIYFRVHFDFAASATGAKLFWSGVVDDGAAFYVNGTEAGRVRMGTNSITFTNWATANSPNEQTNVFHAAEGPFELDASALVTGDNVLAVEVHQTMPSPNPTSDVVLSVILTAQAESFDSTPQPRLTIARFNNLLVISWAGAGFCLQETTQLGAGASWGPSSVANGVAFTPSGPQKFYRLISCP